MQLFGKSKEEPVFKKAAELEEKGSSLITNLELKDLNWQLQKGGTEAQNFYVHLDDGGFVLIQLGYSAIGFSPITQTMFRYKKGDKEIVFNGSFSGPKINGSGIIVDVNNKTEVVGNEMRVNLTFDKTSVSFVFTGQSKACMIKDGKTTFGKEFLLQRYLPVGIVKGKISGSENFDFSGQAALYHAVQTSMPHTMASCCDAISIRNSDGDGIFIVQFLIPNKLVKPDMNRELTQAIITKNNQIVMVTTNSKCTHISSSVNQPTGYKLADHKKWEAEGANDVDKTVRLSVEVTSKNSFATIDILGVLPYLVKKVLQALVASPYSFLWFEDNVGAVLQVDGSDIKISGSCYHELTYINKD
jgi:hypothetical protein